MAGLQCRAVLLLLCGAPTAPAVTVCSAGGGGAGCGAAAGSLRAQRVAQGPHDRARRTPPRTPPRRDATPLHLWRRAEAADAAARPRTSTVFLLDAPTQHGGLPLRQSRGTLPRKRLRQLQADAASAARHDATALLWSERARRLVREAPLRAHAARDWSTHCAGVRDAATQGWRTVLQVQGQARTYAMRSATRTQRCAAHQHQAVLSFPSPPLSKAPLSPPWVARGQDQRRRSGRRAAQASPGACQCAAIGGHGTCDAVTAEESHRMEREQRGQRGGTHDE